MKCIQLILVTLFFFAATCLFGQAEGKVYEVTITTTDGDGNTEVKDFVIEGEDMSQEDIDALVREQLDGTEAEVDVNVNVIKVGAQSGEESKTITKIIKRRSNLGDENKIILEEQDMEVEVIDDKVYINGEEVKEGEFGDTKVRVLKFEEGDDYELKQLLDEENIEIGERENIYYIEKEENKEGVAFLGVTIGRATDGPGAPISWVVPGASAEKIGLQKGDKLISINGNEVTGYSTLSKIIKAYLPGEKVKVVYNRDGEVMDATVELSDYYVHVKDKRSHGRRGRQHHQKYRNLNPNSPVLGVKVSEQEGVIIVQGVVAGGSAEKAGVQVGDQIMSINKVEMKSTTQFQHAVRANAAGDEIKLKLKRDGKKMNSKATLQSMKDAMGQRYPNNTSQRIERIVIRDKKDSEIRNEERGEMKINEFELSPNPSPGNVRVDFSMEDLRGESMVVRIISLDGKVVRENKVNNFDGHLIKNYDLSDMEAGIYLFQVENSDRKFTERFVIERD